MQFAPFARRGDIADRVRGFQYVEVEHRGAVVQLADDDSLAGGRAQLVHGVVDAVEHRVVPRDLLRHGQQAPRRVVARRRPASYR